MILVDKIMVVTTVYMACLVCLKNILLGLENDRESKSYCEKLTRR